MSHRINVMIEDGVWEELKRVPDGERSHFINMAVSNEILQRKRRQAIQIMDRLRRTGKPLEKPAERLVRSDRNRHR
jgi:predicted CopG family antitoxin